MKKYLVKEVSVATEQNPNFKGTYVVSYFGKGEKMVSHEGTGCYWDKFELHPYMIEEYGYNRPQDAKRNWIFKNPENTKYWTSEVEVVEFEI